MRRTWEWLGNFNNLTSFMLLLGVPLSAVGAFVAAVWGHLQHLRISYIAVILAVVFCGILWSWIGIVWLIDRAKAVKDHKNPSKPVLACEWGLTVDTAFLTFDAIQPIACQLSIIIRNLLPWPLRCEVTDYNVDVDGVIPDMKVDKSPPIVVTQGAVVAVSFDGYKKGTISEKTNYKGKIEVHVKYGHPRRRHDSANVALLCIRPYFTAQSFSI